MALSGLVGSTYVHSNIYNMKSIDTDILENGENLGLSDIIKRLKDIRDRLKNDAEAFLGLGVSPEDFSKKLFNSQNDFVRIGIDILTSMPMREKLQQSIYSQNELQKLFHNKVPKIFKEHISNDMLVVSSSEIIDQLIKGLGKKFFTLSAEKQRIELGKIISQEKADKAIIKALKSKKGKIRKIFKEELSEISPKAKFPTIAFDYFKTVFLQRIQQEGIPCEHEDPETFLERVRINLEKFAEVQSSSSASSGSLNEDWNAAIFLSDKDLHIEINVIGKKTESDLEKELIPRLKTHHKENKYSQTDWIITNLKTNKTVRVQNKNGMEILQKIRNNMNVPQINKIQDTTKFNDLINVLINTSTSALTDADIKNLSYLIANSIWFNNKGSYSAGNTNKRKKTTGTIMPNLTKDIERFFSAEIANFIGATYEGNISPNDLEVPQANIFFLFSNKVLMPTYYIFDDIIKQMENKETELFSLQVTFQKPVSSHFIYENASSFYKAKQKAVGRLDYNGDYSDSRLLKIGGEQGQKIMEELTISRINLKTDLATILKSSWAV